MNVLQQRILSLLTKQQRLSLTDLASHLGVSKQYISKIVKPLLKAGVVEKVGSTKGAYLQRLDASGVSYGLNAFEKTFKAAGLKEDEVWTQVTEIAPFSKIPQKVKAKVQYAFTEMLNNAIDHSKAKTIGVSFAVHGHAVFFTIADSGVGIFNSIQKKFSLPTTQTAIQEVLKGKLTTQPRKHTGEGIFFTSKIVDLFQIDSFDQRLRIGEDIFLQTIPSYKGTKVSCRVLFSSTKNIVDIFRQYTNEDFGFDKTEIHVKLYTYETKFISRSEAKRLMHGLEKFQRIVLDFQDVELIGQGFTDEILRVWQQAHKQVEIQTTNTRPSVEFMIQRSLAESK